MMKYEMGEGRREASHSPGATEHLHTIYIFRDGKCVFIMYFYLVFIVRREQLFVLIEIY